MSDKMSLSGEDRHLGGYPMPSLFNKKTYED